MPASHYDHIMIHLEHMKKMSDQFRDLVLEAETRFFKAHFNADGMPDDDALSMLSHDDIFAMH